MATNNTEKEVQLDESMSDSDLGLQMAKMHTRVIFSLPPKSNCRPQERSPTLGLARCPPALRW